MAKASSKKACEIAPIDPMPARVDPCLATLVDKPPKGSDWAYEVKGTCVDATEDASGNLPRYRHVVRR
ncbi:hypothetical protein GOB91_01850 [Sinorhizobium meliloti]|jgi:hypothetical protein|uniref:Uncharacterized protein n=1 Tax=Rhizobium meliloti TaxID=382 RepID=A0AAW9TKH1_RHIML|nr:hypothetical protein SMB554_31500 [Sinorhizobium meliloti]ASP75390.1 hypothetical protein CDO28_28810 [Sinorhizobium meliloti]ASQ07935.1 hypothetical protein CDO23_29850 [Sinorhizobium meliloti]MDW9354805.1 hypothetical protein [Sinorhizobium meliloti]MDW9367725.1 hypothetical protein [Sinorhizobium meliloti]